MRIKNSLVKRIQHWAIFILVIEILILIIFDYVLPKSPEILSIINNSATLKPIFGTIKSLIIETLPVTAIAIFIHPVIEQFNKIEKIIENDERKQFFSSKLHPIEEDIQDISVAIDSISKHKEILSINYSYNETDWKSLLDGANNVVLCMLYTGSEWNRKNFSHFKNYVHNGGKLNIYLPDTSEIHSRFYEKTSMSKVSSDKIYRTISLFQSISSDTTRKGLKVHILNKGFHYMFARIEKSEFNIFLLSPYPNNYNRSESPVILFNENHINHDMRNFIENEVEYLTDSTTFPNFELEKFIIWNVKRNRVFVSTELFCPAGCKFCYVDSLIKHRYRPGSVRLAKMICSVIRNDDRFISGVNGTTIMLGGFSDPFYKKNIDASLEIIDFFSIQKNFIHIATRFPISHQQGLFPPESNVVINYSLSSLRSDLEVSNQQKRFEGAKYLISKGYKVALFLRPIIQDITIHEIGSIIELSRKAGINEITVGGLYIDDKIRSRLSDINIDVLKVNKVKKDFVLDDSRILEKLEIKDIDVIYQKLQDEGFNVFPSSDQRIEYYKNS